MGSDAITGAAVGVTVGVIVRFLCAGTVECFPRDHPRRDPSPLGPVTRSVGLPHRLEIGVATPPTTTPRDRSDRGASS
jgi:hypothetical protein